MIEGTHLTFSDSAKYAEAAKNFIFGNGLSVHHSFFDPNVISSFQTGQSFPAGFLPLTSLILSIAFRIFGVSDGTVFFTGLFFYILCLLLVFLIAKQLFSAKAGIVSVFIFLSTLFFHEYLANFSSEIPFTFEILLITYLFLKIKKPIIKWLLVIMVFVAAYFTRQQVALIFASFGFSFLMVKYLGATHRQRKIIIVISGSVLLIGFFALLLTRNSLSSPLYLLGSSQISTLEAPGAILRGKQISLAAGETFTSKILYNFYNFAKAPERLASPLIFMLFLVFLFLKTKTPKARFFKIFSSSVFILLVLGASATLPNARYIHPIMPLLYIGAGIALVAISESLINKNIFRNLFIISSLLFLSLPALGHYTLDARAVSHTQNQNEPPIYRQIAGVMAENIPQGHLIVTNLDAWAAWYEGLTTVWFPLSPDMLDLSQKPEYIVITNYLENDRDFDLGEWKEVVYSPSNISNQFLKKNYSIQKTFVILPKENKENLEIKGTILKLK